jgi:Mn2+/Fe2+ NRAMP family transporter
VLARPKVLEIVSGAIHPALPPQDGIYSPALIVLAVLASTMGSSSSLKYSSYVYEKGWRDVGHLRLQRTDLLMSLGGMFCVLFLMQVVAAATLRPLNVQVRELEDLVPIFGQTMGTAGVLLFGVLLWCITFSVYIGNAAGYGIMFSDVYHRFVRPSVEVIKHGKERHRCQRTVAGGLHVSFASVCCIHRLEARADCAGG